MKRLVLILLTTLLFIGCGSDSSAKEAESIESSKAESVAESIVESNIEDTSIAAELQSEEVQSQEVKPTGPEHMIADWSIESVGPMTFDAPVSWKSKNSDSTFAFFSPEGRDGEYLGYFLSVGFNENRNGNLETFVSRDLEQYANVSQEDMEVLGYPATRLEYKVLDDGRNMLHIVYYIQIYPESGLGMIEYSGPAIEADLYMEDFERLFNSLEIDGAAVSKTDSGKKYVLNTATGTFHTPDCYKVKEIENAETVVTTAEELVAQGNKACGICNPN